MAVKKRFPYKAAFVACNGDCNAVHEEKCTYGCIGCGTCESVCKFGAIHLDPKTGVAKVSEDACIACGMCVRSCPQGIIWIHECANFIVVACSNRDKGAEARKQCDVSCIGCGLCERTCTAKAVKVTDNCAMIDERYCLSCGICAVKCPRHAIRDIRGILTK